MADIHKSVHGTVQDMKDRQLTAAHARSHVMAMFDKGCIRDNSSAFPKFQVYELSLGKVLGKGGFGTVYEVRGFDSMDTSYSSVSNKPLDVREDGTEQDGDEGVMGTQLEQRKFIATHCIRKGGDARYAVKFLSKEIVAKSDTFLQGAVDMFVETRILSDTEHPNIIKLRATCIHDPFHPEYFIVMDRLYDTLQKRIKTWATRVGRTQGIMKKIMDRSGKKGSALYEERIVAAFDLSAALEYLHKRNIVYRDLKPENVGFDIRDDVKIFDFGLAKELRESDRNQDGTYNLTAMTGSLRYMAPEVANGKPYNTSCDSYSFGILLWHMLALKEPYELYNSKSLREKVYNGPHKRPPMDESWSNAIKIGLKRSWTEDIHERSTMQQITEILRKEAIRARGGDDTGLEHMRRRSTFVFRNNK